MQSPLIYPKYIRKSSRLDFIEDKWLASVVLIAQSVPCHKALALSHLHCHQMRHRSLFIHILLIRNQLAKKWPNSVRGQVKESKSEVAQLCLTLCDPMDYTVHGILQARILEWVAFPFSRGPSQPRGRTRISYVCCFGRQFLYH